MVTIQKRKCFEVIPLVDRLQEFGCKNTVVNTAVKQLLEKLYKNVVCTAILKF